MRSCLCKVADVLYPPVLVQQGAPPPDKVDARPCTLATRLIYRSLVLERALPVWQIFAHWRTEYTLDCCVAPCSFSPSSRDKDDLGTRIVSWSIHLQTFGLQGPSWLYAAEYHLEGFMFQDRCKYLEDASL